jgi:hypothetical protein
MSTLELFFAVVAVVAVVVIVHLATPLDGDRQRKPEA